MEKFRNMELSPWLEIRPQSEMVPGKKIKIILLLVLPFFPLLKK